MLGAGEGEFSSPLDIVVHPWTGRVFVADAEAGVVKAYDPVTEQRLFVFGSGFPSAIALDAAKDVSFPAPLTAAAMQQFLAAAAMGHGRKDDGVVVKVYEATANVDVAAAAKRS